MPQEAHHDLVGKPAFRYEAACASGGTAILGAIKDIRAGDSDCVLLLGVEQMKLVSPQEGGNYLGAAANWEEEAKGVQFPFPKLFGRLGAEYMTLFKIPKEQYADDQATLAEMMYRNARDNPLAQTRDWSMDRQHARHEDTKLNSRISDSLCFINSINSSSLMLISFFNFLINLLMSKFLFLPISLLLTLNHLFSFS